MMKAETLIIILIFIVVALVVTCIAYRDESNSYADMYLKESKINIQLEKINRDLTTENRNLKFVNECLRKEVADWQTIKDAKLTAYCPCEECSEEWGKQTASGKEATEGRTVAVDKSIIPLGSEIIINGNKYIAEDVGGGVDGLHIDIYMENHEATEEFGVQKAGVKVKKKK